jgi:hypothetical protein
MHKLLALIVAIATVIPAFPQTIPVPREASATQVMSGTGGSDTYVSPRRLRGFIPSPVSQSGKVLQSNGSGYVLEAPPGGTWGTITGDITSQADLNTALGLRVLSTTLATYFANPAVHVSFAPAAWRAALDLEPGVDYQPFNSNLNAFATNGSAYYLSRSNHSGPQSADTIEDGTTNKAYTAAEQTKLAGIETGAQVNRAIASQAEAEAGLANDKDMTPLRVKQAIQALAATGNVTNNGTLTDNYIVMGGGGAEVKPTTIQVTGGNNIVFGNVTAGSVAIGNVTGATSDFELPWIGDQATGKFFKGNITVGPNMTRNKVGNNIVLDSISGGGGSLPGGMATLWTTADLGSLPADYIVSGSNGTDGPDTLGNRTVVVRSLGTVADPTVDIAPGAVPAGTVVTMSTATDSPFFTATNNGTPPTYTIGAVGNTFTVSASGTWQYRANKAGWVSSAVQSATYTIDPIPTLSSAVLQASGTDIVIGWPESVSYGAGGTGGYALTLSGGAATVTGVTGGGTNSHTLTVNRTVTNTETGTLAYTQPGNGAEDSAFQDVVTFSGFTIDTSGGPAGGGGTTWIYPPGWDETATGGSDENIYDVDFALLSKITVPSAGSVSKIGMFVVFVNAVADMKFTVFDSTRTPVDTGIATAVVGANGEWKNYATSISLPSAGTYYIGFSMDGAYTGAIVGKAKASASGDNYVTFDAGSYGNFPSSLTGLTAGNSPWAVRIEFTPSP